MTRIHFTFDDIARTHPVESLTPRAEAVFALNALADERNMALAPWRREAVRRLGDMNRDIARVFRVLRPVPDLLWLLDGSVEDDHRPVGFGLTRRHMVELVDAFAEIAVVPCWTAIRGHLKAVERTQHQDVHGLLSTLHPQVRLQDTVLHIMDGDRADIRLGRNGLAIARSAFLSSRPAVVVDAERPKMIVSAVPPMSTQWWRAEDLSSTALSALLGKTRATLLRLLRDACSTGELAKRAGVSAGAVSQHIGVLRDAGLITTARERNTVQHSLTVLGEQLVLARV
ncbi:ArsR/SmtB family transcription factor [Kibdelosporangium aridum]|uniref:ArsR/SmtB family transcription factor n=1 Tax=Kibdelosporangium aridum TaxID=2030 RepID=UPI00068BB992